MNSVAEFGYFRKASAENSGRAQRLPRGALKTLAGTTKNKKQKQWFAGNRTCPSPAFARNQLFLKSLCPASACQGTRENLCALPLFSSILPQKGKESISQKPCCVVPRQCFPCENLCALPVLSAIENCKIRRACNKKRGFCDAERCDNTGLPDQSQTCERNNNCRPHYDLRPAIHMAVASRCFHWLLPVVGSLLLVSKGFHVYVFIHDTRIFKNQNHNNGLKQSMFQNMH